MDYIVALLAFFTFFALLCRRDIVWAFALLAALLPAYVLRFSLGPIPSTVVEVMVLMILGRTVYELGRNRQAWQSAWKTMYAWRYFKPGVLLIIAALIASFVGDDLRAGLGIWRAYFVEPFLLACVARLILKTEHDWHLVYRGLGVAVLGLTMIAVYQYFTGMYLPTWEWTVAETRRATGVYTSPNSLALFVVPVSMLFLSRLWATRRWKSFDSAVVMASVLCLALSQSTGGIIAFLAGLALIAYSQGSKRWTIITATILIAFTLIIPHLRSAILPVASFQQASGQSRLALYQGSLALIQQHPILGTGLARFGEAFERVRPAEFTEKLIYPHNIFLNFWLETGLLGLVSLLWIIVIAIRKPSLLGVSAALLTMLIHGLVDVPYFKNDLALLTWILLSRDILNPYETDSRTSTRS